MQRPIFKPVGTSVENLDTPALVVDLKVLSRNIESMHSFFRDRPVRLRPNVASHQCPAIAHMQLATGSTVMGVTVPTVSQAEVFVHNGILDVRIAPMVVTTPKIRRLCALAHHTKISVSVDNASNVNDLSEAATAAGITLNVIVNVNVEAERGLFGVDPGRPALALASQIVGASGLHMVGVMAYDVEGFVESTDDFVSVARAKTQRLLDTRQELERANMEVEVVSAGNTRNYDLVADMDGVTEIQAGVYALSDLRHQNRFEPAASVIGSVSSLPEPGVMITDTGRKAVGNDTGEPSLDNLPGATLRSLSAEHGIIDLNGPIDAGLGDLVWHTPWDVGACVNLYDYMYGVRDGRLELVWEIQSRGRYR